MLEQTTAQAWADRLLALGLAVQTRVNRLVREAARTADYSLAEAVAEQAGDRIYAIDRDVEAVIEHEIERWPDACRPLLLICEGVGDDGRRMFPADRDVGSPSGNGWRLLVDPIDGTRMLMYDKRSAWFLAAVAPDHGDDTRLSHAVASVIVELPTSRQLFADAFVATPFEPTRGLRFATRLHTPCRIDAGTPIPAQPSQATHLKDGFLSVFGALPGSRRYAADLMEFLAHRLEESGHNADFFDDQYISTGGQMVQLMTGRDRCCIDLRPLSNRLNCGGEAEESPCEARRSIARPCLVSHPYDAAGLLAARQAGVIITNAFGQPLDAPLDVHTGVHWCGYANEHIQNLIAPLIAEWLGSHGLAAIPR